MCTDPWETGFVDLAGGQGLLGQVEGRTSTAVRGWLQARSEASRAALPGARIAVDHFHLIMLANRAVTAVRQRVTRELLGRHGRAVDPTWANRRLLLRARERLSARALTRMWNGCLDHDPTGQILTAGSLRKSSAALCATAAAGGHRHDITTRLWSFYTWCADADIPEVTTLAETIATWRPAVEVFLTTGLTNARTESTNRLIKQINAPPAGSETETTTAAEYGCTAPGAPAGRQREPGAVPAQS